MHYCFRFEYLAIYFVHGMYVSMHERSASHVSNLHTKFPIFFQEISKKFPKKIQEISRKREKTRANRHIAVLVITACMPGGKGNHERNETSASLSKSNSKTKNSPQRSQSVRLD